MLVREEIVEEIETLVLCWYECKMVQVLWKTVWWFLRKTKIELLYDLEIPLLGKYPEDLKERSQRDTCTVMFIAALFTIVKS